MAQVVNMPKQGLQMTEGTIVEWFFKEGEPVTEGKPLFEMETDKLSISIDSPATGTLLKIIRDAGDVVPITEAIAIIGNENEDIASLLSDLDLGNEEEEDKEEEKPNSPEVDVVREKRANSREEGGRTLITPRAKALARDNDLDYEGLAGSGPDGMLIEADIQEALEDAENNKIKASPVVLKMAKDMNLDLSKVKGTGVNGKVMKEDVEAYQESMASTEQHVMAKDCLIPFTSMRKAIANNMTESLSTMAQANHRMKVDMSELVRLRQQFKDSDLKISYNDIMVRIVSQALVEHPYLNSSWTDEGILLKGQINVGLAVAVSNGLIVPNIKNANHKSLVSLADESSQLINKALEGSLAPEDYRNGTFTITNLGMFDIDEFTAIINTPEAGILALGKIEETPVVEKEEILIKPIMTLSLTYDHRIVDGADAAKFLQTIKKYMLAPSLML